MLKQMRYFQAVVKYKNFSEAAEACFISQSAISQQIQALEKELGVQLLIREKRKFSLTPAGEYFYKQSIVLLHDADKLVEKTRQLASGGQIVLRLGYPRQYRGSELQQVLPLFQEKYPQIALHLVSGTHEELYDRLRTDKLDIAINDLRRKPSEHYVNYYLATEQVYVALPASNPLTALVQIDTDDLKSLPCVLVSSLEHRENDEAFYREYFGIQGDFLLAESQEQAQLYVLSGQGVYLETRRSPQAGKVGNIRYLPLRHEDYYIFWKAEREEAYLEDFAAMLESMFID